MNSKYTFLLVLVLILGSCKSENNNVYEWRGNGRTGIFPDTGLLEEWPPEGPPELWAIEGLGNGHGSPTFTDKHFYITGEKDTMAVLQCYDIEGNAIWESVLGPEWTRSYPGSRSAPTIVGNLLYTVTGMGDIFCVDSENGEIIWSKKFIDDADGIPIMHGFSEAPVIDGDMVFWVPGGRKVNAAALDRFTGEYIWISDGVGERSGYNQGNLIRLADRNIFVTFSAYHLMGFDTKTGELLWTHEQDNLEPAERKLGMGDTHSNSVIFDDGFIYYQAGDGNCGVKLNLSGDGSEITEVWRNGSFDGFMGGIVKYGDYIFGSSATKPELRVINALTGTLTDSLRIGQGALIAADKMLYYYSQAGRLHLLSHEQGKVSDVSSFRISRGSLQHFAHPVINKGILYQRHGDVLMAFDIRE